MRSQENPINESCPPRGCDIVTVHTHLLRFTFRLPEPIGVADGYTDVQIYHSDRPDGALTFAHLTIRQVEMESDDPTTLSSRSIARLDRTVTGDDDLPLSQNLHSVAQVITLANSPDQPPQDWNQQAQNLNPREDSFMRALHAVQTLVRGVRLAGSGRPPLLPTYERAPSIILVDDMTVEAPLALDDLGDLDWDAPSIMLLHHNNLPGDRPQVVPDGLIHGYEIEIGHGNPGILAKERFIDAQRLIHVDGDYSAAVVSAATGIEVLSDALLSALLWEEHVESDGEIDRALTDASGLFSGDVTPLRRAQTQTVSRLGGDWASSASPWQVYRSGAASLRNRIVHAGYQPNRPEVIAAYQQALDGQTFLFNRLAEQRSTYPRTCLIFLGPDGLKKRDLYSGKVKRLFEQTTATDTSWSASFSAWHQALMLEASA